MKKTCVVSYFSKDFLTIEFNHFQSPMDNGDHFRFPLKKTLKKKCTKGKKKSNNVPIIWNRLVDHSSLLLIVRPPEHRMWLLHCSNVPLETRLVEVEGEHTDCLHEALETVLVKGFSGWCEKGLSSRLRPCSFCLLYLLGNG